MHVYCICATHNRHTLLERGVGMFLAQDYEGEHTLSIHNNSPISLKLDNISLPRNKHIILLNRAQNSINNEPYYALGEFYRDSLHHIPINCDIVTFWDDDDGLLPFHIAKGVEGLKRSGKTAYKPKYSYFFCENSVKKVSNNLEPSIFCKIEHIRKHGFSDAT